jgi:hypothetical membrane protein
VNGNGRPAVLGTARFRSHRAGREGPPGPEQRRTWIRIGALAGVAGPAAFTLAWIVAALRQPGKSFAAVQISGLAADDARDPWIMIGGFLVLGGCGICFGRALNAALGGRGRAGPAPAVIQTAGALAVAAGLLRRDHVLLTTGPESWHNHAHDVVSAAVYVLLVSAPVLLAHRFRGDPRWRGLAVPLVAAAVASAGLLAVFYATPQNSWDATLQRIAVTLPLAAIAAVAGRLATIADSTGDADAIRDARRA